MPSIAGTGTPLGGAPEEVAAAVSWLCRRDSQSISGQAIALAGGEVT